MFLNIFLKQYGILLGIQTEKKVSLIEKKNEIITGIRKFTNEENEHVK